MANWDDEDWEDDVAGEPAQSGGPARPLAGGGGAGADALGDWDDEDASDDGAGAKEESGRIAPAPMKPKKALAKALKEKEEAERAKEVARIKQREKEMSELSETQRKLREQQIVEEADFQHTKDLFSGGAAGDAKGRKDEKDEDAVTIDSFRVETDADLAKLASMIGERVCEFNNHPRKTGRYIEFVKGILRVATKNLNVEDTNELNSFLTVVSNEKRDELKRAKGVKKKSKQKANVRVDRAGDMRENDFDDFADDFM